MLTELLERLRGYDKWVRTQATIVSSNLQEPEAGKERGERRNYNNEFLQWQATCEAAWTDGFGVPHLGRYVADEHSPLFQLFEGQRVTLRYNPASPDQFYIRGMVRTEPPSERWVRYRLVTRFARLTFWAILVLWFGYRLWIHKR